MKNAVYLALVFSGVLHALLFVLGSRQKNEVIAFKHGFGAIEVSSAPGATTKIGEGPVVSSISGDVSSAEAGVLEGGSSLGIAPPEYPRLSRLRGEQGDVLLHLQLNKAGELIAVEVAKSSGYSTLDSSAVSSVKNGLRSASDTTIAREPKIRFRFELKSP